MNKSLSKIIDGNYWFIFGILAYLGTSLSSIVRSIEPVSIGNNLYMAVDWFGACVPYFFFGAVIGFCIDWFFAKKRNEKIKFPLWFWLSAILYVGSIIIVAIFSRQGLLSPGLTIFFPMAFSIFFVGEAFVLLTPDIIEKSFYGKLFFDLIYIASFSLWLYLSLYKKDLFKITKYVLIIILFLIMLLGFSGCIHFLS